MVDIEPTEKHRRSSLGPCLLFIALAVGAGCSGPEDSSEPGVTISEQQAQALGMPVRTSSDDVTEEQAQRRARSLSRWEAEGVRVLDSLPVVESEAACHFRTRDEIVDRAVALIAVASRGAGDPNEYVTEITQRYETARRYSPRERAFMENPTAEQALELSWRFEALYVLLWALGYVDNLSSPARPTPGVEIAEIVRSQTLEELRAGARVRAGAELLDLADLVYGYHWAAVEARLHQRAPPTAVSPDVVSEWHHAINWLIGYHDAPWDDVSTDT